jgi:nucleotide-binding universal stress UspA family protein
MQLIHKVLVPTDFSDCADRALDHAIELCRAFSTPLVIAHVYVPPRVIVPDGYVTPLVEEPLVRAEIEAGLGRLAARARERGVAKAEVILGEGVAWREVIRLAKENECDLIVMGTHGRGAIGHLLLGSVAEKVIRKAECPVLTVGPRSLEA